MLVQSQQRDEAVSTVLEVLPAHPSRRVVLARMEGVAAEESQHMLHDGPQTAGPTVTPKPKIPVGASLTFLSLI